MISKHVNRLSIQQIIFLNYILSKCSSSPLVEGVKIALPIVFETNIRNQLNYENPKAIASAISYGFRSKCSSDETLGMNISKRFLFLLLSELQTKI